MKNRILSIFFVLTLAVSLQSCFEVDEPINIVKPAASIVFNDNALTDGASFSVANGTVSFKIKVSDVSGTITSVALANRYTITGNSTVKVQNLPSVTLSNNEATVSIPMGSLRLPTDPVLTFANRGVNTIRVTVTTSEGVAVRLFNLMITA